MVCSAEAETIDDRTDEMTETTKIRDGLWSYRGWYIKMIPGRAGVSSDKPVTRYEIADNLRDLEEYIGLTRFTDLSVAKAHIRKITKSDK